MPPLFVNQHTLCLLAGADRVEAQQRLPGEGWTLGVVQVALAIALAICAPYSGFLASWFSFFFFQNLCFPLLSKTSPTSDFMVVQRSRLSVLCFTLCGFRLVFKAPYPTTPQSIMNKVLTELRRSRVRLFGQPEASDFSQALPPTWLPSITGLLSLIKVRTGAAHFHVRVAASIHLAFLL